MTKNGRPTKTLLHVTLEDYANILGVSKRTVFGMLQDNRLNLTGNLANDLRELYLSYLVSEHQKNK